MKPLLITFTQQLKYRKYVKVVSVKSLLTVISWLTILWIGLMNRADLLEASYTTTIAGSVGNTDNAWNFPLYGSGIFIVPNNHPSQLPIFYVADRNLCVVRQIIGNQSKVVAGTGECSPFGADSVPGTESALQNPKNMYYDSNTGFLYILDKSFIKILDTNSGIINRMLINFSENNLIKFTDLNGITMFNGDIYVADVGTAVIWQVKITHNNVGIATISVGSLNNFVNFGCNNVNATNCKLINPTSITFFPDGTKAIADSNRVIIVTAITNLAYVAPISISLQDVKQVMAYDSYSLLISDLGQFNFLKFNKDEQSTSIVFKTSNTGGNTYFGLVKQIDSSKNVYFLTSQDPTTYRNHILSFNFNETNLPTSNFTSLYGLYDLFQFNYPHSALSIYLSSPKQLRLSSLGNQLYFPAYGNVIVKLDLNSGLASRIAGSMSQFGYNQDNISATRALLKTPHTVLELDSGDIIISDTLNNRIRKIDSNGIITTIVGTGTEGNSGDYGPASACRISAPQGLATPPLSMKGQYLFDFSDSGNSRIRRIQNDLTILPLLSSDKIVYPSGIMYTPNGDLYIASKYNSKILKYSNSQLSTVAGTGLNGYSGDGGLATNAELYHPSDIAVSPTGEVYIAVGLSLVYYKLKVKSRSEEESEKLILKTEQDWMRTESTSTSVPNVNTRNHFHIRDKQYVKSKKLGTGSNGTVWMFEELTTKEQVAVKIIEFLNPHGNEFKEVVNMFELSEKANPHIVPILGCTMVENGGYICILMPLYKCDLRNWMYSNKDSVPIELIVEIVKQIALALQYLHSKQMVHRDLKQTNIFISKSPDMSKNPTNISSFELCVGDWGSSRYQTRSSLTSYEGTIQYSAPESVLESEFSTKSDIWSLGCILYQLLSSDYNTCLMRVKQTSMNDQADSQIMEKVESVFLQRSDHAKTYNVICDLLLRMLKYNPNERISIGEIIQKLSKC